MGRWSRRRFLAMVGVSLGGGALYAFGIEPNWLAVERIGVRLPALPAAFDGYLVAQLSDLHVGGGVDLDFLAGAVDAAMAARPDLIVVTGDLVDACGAAGSASEAAAVLRGLRAPDGVRAVLGNHDTGAYHPGAAVGHTGLAQLLDRMESAGVEVLENEARTIRRGEARMRLVGLGDYWSGRFDPGPAGIRGDEPVTLALSHNPDTAPELARRGADLVLCGHTHGGQVNLPLVGPPYFPQQHREFVAGLYPLGHASQLYVNRGLGYTRYRVRFNARPEMTLLTLFGDGGAPAL